MAVAVDAVSFDDTTFVLSGSWAHTIAGADRILIVGIFLRHNTTPTVASVSWSLGGGEALTKLRHDDAGVRARTEIWYKVAPTAGAGTISVTFTGTYEDGYAGAISFTGVDQANPFDDADGAGNTGSAATSASADITTSSAGSWPFAVLGKQFATGDVTIGGGHTQLWNQDMVNADGRSAGARTGAAVSASTTTFSWTWTTNANWAISIAAVKATGAAVLQIERTVFDYIG
jgi:hypothetical protein